jgi:hypothetical protein
MPKPTGLLPVFAIDVFIGFTISQTGLVRHWLQQRGRGWVGKAALNGTGAVLTAVAGVVLFASQFTEGTTVGFVRSQVEKGHYVIVATLPIRLG